MDRTKSSFEISEDTKETIRKAVKILNKGGIAIVVDVLTARAVAVGIGSLTGVIKSKPLLTILSGAIYLSMFVTNHVVTCYILDKLNEYIDEELLK